MSESTKNQQLPGNELLEAFRAGFGGELITPQDAAYDETRKVYNGMIDRHPALIARCADVTDVIASIHFAREHQLRLAVRGGGHNGGGLGTCDDGLVLDLSLMNQVEVDPQNRTVRVGGGCTQGEVDAAAHEHGLAVPAGVISTTGIGGLTLGGGHGYLACKHGLTIDNLLSADVVLADGNVVTASDQENPDLFWAIRGGGGNFGVVVSFVFQAHPVDTIMGGPVLWDLDQAADVMRWYREFTLTTGPDLYGFFAFMTVPPAPPFPEHLHNRKMCGIVFCYTGPMEEAETALAPIKSVGEPALYGIQEMPFTMLQGAFDGLYPAGLQWYWRGDFVRELSDEAIERHLEFAHKLPTMHSTMHMYPVNGAVHNKGEGDTAFSYRDVVWSTVYAGVDPDPANAGAIKEWCVDYWEALHRYSAGGAYVNFMMNEGDARVQATYRSNYPRLREVKGKYDPDNVFRINQNITPA